MFVIQRVNLIVIFLKFGFFFFQEHHIEMYSVVNGISLQSSMCFKLTIFVTHCLNDTVSSRLA